MRRIDRFLQLQGSIAAVSTGLGTASSGLGPFLVGYLGDTNGTYSYILFGLGMAVLGSAVFLLFVPTPVRKVPGTPGVPLSQATPVQYAVLDDAASGWDGSSKGHCEE